MRNGLIKLAILAFAVTLILYNPICAEATNADTYASSTASKYGYINPGIDLEWPDKSSKLQKSGMLPASYDMRGQIYGSKVQIRDQEETGLCWAFAMVTAAEVNYYHTYGDDATKMMFSPLHLGYFTYNRVSDAMNLTVYDRNLLQNNNYKDVGGNSLIAVNSLSGWTGFALENKMPFDNRDNVRFDSGLAYDNEMILKGAYFINPDDPAAIKSAVMEYGAVTADIYMHDEYLFDDYKDSNDVYNSKAAFSNHTVVIIGWDDKLDAWIAQNSWGSEWGDDGCFFVSYNEPSISLVTAVEVQPAQEYENNYFYDGTAGGEYVTMSSGDQAANMFIGFDDIDEDTYHLLEAVGMTVYDTGYCKYTIDIYKDCDNNNPVSGTNVVSFDVESETAGFYTYELPSAVKVEAGERYSVVVTFHQDTDVAIEKNSSIGKDIIFSARTGRGQSFISSNGGLFVDCHSYGVSMRLKAFTNSVEYEPVNINRYAGQTRYNTAESVSDALKEEQQIEKFETVIVASGESFPDALSGSCLSADKDNAPIILTGKTVESETIEYIDKNLNENGKVYILGGTGVVSDYLEQELIRRGYAVERLAGNDRYGTNVAILDEIDVEEDVLVCSGTGYADSLSASAVGKPIMLTGNQLTNEQISFLKLHKPDNIYIIGGTGAVSTSTEADLRSLTHHMFRLEGDNRYQTSVMVAENFFGSEIETAVFVYGLNFPDGLAAGPLALELGAPILLADNNKSNASYSEAFMDSVTEADTVTVLGGATLISDKIVKYIIN